MEKRVEISLLMDFYGELLTDKQKSIMMLYYNEDLSLKEISELNETSRQAIHDLIKRCYKQLLSYEEKLGLLEKSLSQEKAKEEILKELNSLDHQIVDEKQKKKIYNIEQLVKETI
ncbi:putative DNA-binding protein [Clostridium hydrogeniformans]|uniref:putative DNA-binding protein n=1 Tax=Clostridium hydrogeniformans TaxID=349933 RepID=UPI000483B174|nr:putative DNA-binding protein [Clostridium hydrogeniformans]